MLENHGVVVGGEDLASAFQRFETLEFTARTILRARQLGEVRYLTDAQIEHAWKSTNSLPECAPRPPSSIGKEMRKAVRDLVRRAYEHGLMASTWGSFSAASRAIPL